MSSEWKKQDKSLILLMREEFLGFMGEQQLLLIVVTEDMNLSINGQVYDSVYEKITGVAISV